MKMKWIIALVATGLFLFALSRLEVGGLAYGFRQMRTGALGLVFALQVVTQLLLALHGYMVARKAGMAVSFWGMLYVNSQGAVVDAITPGVKIGGEIARVVRLKHEAQATGEEAAAVVALQKIYSLGALGVILLPVLGYAMATLPLGVAFFVGAALWLVLLATVVFIPRKVRAWVEKLRPPRLRWMLWVRGVVLSALGHLTRVEKRRGAEVFYWIPPLIIWSLFPLKLYILAVGIYPGASMAHIFAITFVAYMVAMLPIFPGGLGGFEGSMAGLLVAIGFGAGSAVALTLVFRFVTFWFVVGLSLCYIGGRKLGRGKHATK
ncbi:MAG: flippase-like domain-containing protein [Defluviitaleaceae bacterium]|nr:flippase-like domain-containing protein [Defluviitaleaceae bacterium]MCL2239044.1 flippase-like domain-containing protein [Defluviitaleaceae bacterium]